MQALLPMPHLRRRVAEYFGIRDLLDGQYTTRGAGLPLAGGWWYAAASCAKACIARSHAPSREEGKISQPWLGWAIFVFFVFFGGECRCRATGAICMAGEPQGRHQCDAVRDRAIIA